MLLLKDLKNNINELNHYQIDQNNNITNINKYE